MSRDNNIFIDSWALVALANRKDNWHELAKKRFNSINKKKLVLYISDYILDEVITQVFKNDKDGKAIAFLNGIFESIYDGGIKLEWINKERFDSAKNLREKFHDKPDISFTDLTSFVVMKELKIIFVYSNDDHFEKVNMGFNIWREEL